MGSKTSGRVTAAPRRRPIGWTTVAMRELEAGILCAVQYDCNVLITGENVVGRTSVAHRIHGEGRRAAVSMVVAGSPGALDSLDTLDRALLEASPEGAVLLENPELMAPLVQTQLLRFIESAMSAGTDRRPQVHGSYVRFITTTGIDLFERVRLRQFHESLFYRLNTIHLLSSPLRNRVESVSAVSNFRDRDPRGSVPHLSKAPEQRLAAYAWPGNLGELRGAAESLGLIERPLVLEPDGFLPRIRR